MTAAQGSESSAVRATAPERLELEAFLVTHHARLVRLATLVCGDAASAQDIVQTALERAWKSRGTFRAESPLRPWLDRIVVREAARERRSRLARLSRMLLTSASTRTHASAMEPVDGSAAGLPEQVAVRHALAALGPRHRAVVVLHLHAGYTVDETAAILGIPRETVRSRLRIARERLRSALSEIDA